MSKPLPTAEYPGEPGKSAEDDLVTLYMGRRHALLMELAAVENYLIKRGRLRRRTVPTRQERNERAIATIP